MLKNLKRKHKTIEIPEQIILLETNKNLNKNDRQQYQENKILQLEQEQQERRNTKQVHCRIK